MKRLFIFLILSFSLSFKSCGLFDYEEILTEAKEMLSIDQDIVTADFGLPKSIDYGAVTLQVEWESSSELIEIYKSPLGNVTAKVDFESNKTGDTEVTLTATISLFGQSTIKDFVVTIPKYDLDVISAKKIDFENRLDKDGPLTEGCLPSVGTPNVLVIPVNLDDSNKTDYLLNEIEIAFNGTSDETGFESVNSYYKKSSYGKLDIKFNVIDEWFTPKNSKSYYERYSSKTGADGSTLLLEEALTYYDDVLDYSDYDYNNDDYIDAVWLIYNCEVKYYSSDSIYWAFVYWDYENNEYDNKKSYYYGFAGTDFMHPTEDEAGTYDPSNIKVDAHTYIHETGHLLGLDDYYDYDESFGAHGGLYGADMMDFNIGDHSAISKLLLGWVTPTVVAGKGTVTLDLSSFAETGECIVIANKRLTSIYDEYYMIEFYDNSGLNFMDKPIESYGVKVTKIRAQKNYSNGVVEFNGGNYSSGFKYDNSDEKELFVDLICSKKDIVYKKYSLSGKVLFTEKQYLKEDYFKFVVDKCDASGATLTITIN